MIFFPEGHDRKDEEWMWRYKTWDEALAGHQKIVQALKTGNFLFIQDLLEEQ